MSDVVQDESVTTVPALEQEQQLKANMDLVAYVANQLVERNSGFGHLVASMLASRQLYAMCLYELEWLMGEDFLKSVPAPEGSDTPIQLNADEHVMLKEILINAAAVQAQQPFDEKVLFDGLTKVVFPWAKKVVEKHTTWQNEERKKQVEERERIRIQTPIDIGIRIYSDAEVLKAGDPTKLIRNSSILFVGETKVINWLSDKLTANSVADGSGAEAVVRLARQAPKVNDPRLICVPADGWKNCAENNTSFQKLYANFVLPQLSNPVDLVVVDNILNTLQGMKFAAFTTVANEAQHRLKKWTEAAGALLVSFLPLERQLRDNELNTPEYETLRMHNVLRAVVAEEIAADEKTYRILVGQQEVAVVTEQELDTYQTRTIILP
jgi:hypothetical protein